MTGEPVRVLIAEDSMTSRELLAAILSADSGIQVVGFAQNGEEAVRITKELRPNLVLMDAQMPKMNGFQATKAIMVECPTPIIIISASLDSREVNISLEALRMGALTVLGKPSGPTSPSFEKEGAELIRMVKAMAEVKTIRHWPAKAPSSASANKKHAVAAVVIAASTGGPQALAKILGSLTVSIDAPILIVQHIGPQFLDGLVQWLGACTAMPVKVARAGEIAHKSTVYLAAQNYHLEISAGGKLSLTSAPPVCGFRPSADVLFTSAAKAYGASTLGVVLTGMGSDGAVGACVIKKAGGVVIAQDEATSVVFGMPKAAIDNGCVGHVVALPGIAAKIQHLAGVSQRRV